MSQKGQKVGEVDYVFRRSTSNSTGVVTTLNVTGLEVEADTPYIVEIHQHKGRNGRELLATAEVRTSKKGNQITVPQAVVKETDAIKPGVPAILKLFELVEEEPDVGVSDSASVLGRHDVSSDPTCEDNCDARLYSERAKEYLEQAGGSAELTFRNLRNQQETTQVTHCNYATSGNAISFKKRIRKDIDAQPGDLIEIIKPSDPQDKDVEELIREMHGMMMEMYNEWMEQQND